jgi:hypothetical protein
VAESPIGAAARANYIQAKVDKEYAEARLRRAKAIELELKNAYSEEIHKQQLIHNHQSWTAEEARRASRSEDQEQAFYVLTYITAAVIIVVGLALTGASVYWVRVQGRVKLLEACEREARARAEAQEKERQAYQARATALKVQQGMLIQKYQFELRRLIAEGKIDERAYS